jgi:exosome complex RNA-binding protein Rrp4
MTKNFSKLENGSMVCVDKIKLNVVMGEAHMMLVIKKNNNNPLFL